MTLPDLPEGFVAPVALAEMVGRPIIYRNADARPIVQMEAWLDNIDEGWPVIEFCDNSRATVRPSRIIAYRPTPPSAKE